MTALAPELIKSMWPRAPDGLVQGMASTSATVFSKYGIDSPLLVAHFMAQVSHECGASAEMVENLNYTSPGSIMRTWPRRFPTEASAMPYVRRPQALANKVYSGRMGNRDGSDDGWNFRGRGATQTTGRDGYARLGAKIDADLIASPDRVNEPGLFLECGAADFVLCGCLPLAARDEVIGVTQHLNGGQIGIEQRKAWLARWKDALGVNGAARPETAPLAYGDEGWRVTALQNRLAAMDYAVGKADGKFGPSTRAAVLALQADRALPTTGVVDEATEAALSADVPRPVSEGRAVATAADLRAAGSSTVAGADKVSLTGKATGVLALVAGADQAGVMDTVKDATSQVGALKGAVSGVQDAIQWASSNWWIGALAVGFLLWYFAGRVIKSRVADHRDGSNLGR